MIHQIYADDHRLPTTIASAKEHLDPSQQGRIISRTVAETSFDGMQAIRTTIQKQRISEEATDASVNPGDQEQANSTNLTLRNGYSSVVKGALIQLIPLWDKH